MTTDHSRNAVWQGKDFRHAIDAAGVALWSWNVDTDRLTMDDTAYELWGVPRAGDVTFEDLSTHIHPADRDRVRAAFAATRAILGPYEIDFRTVKYREFEHRGFHLAALGSNRWRLKIR